MKKWKILGGKLKKDKSDLPDTKQFDLAIEVANYSPVAYMYTAEYADFLNTAVRDFGKSIGAAKPDDLNVGMYDALIDSYFESMCASARAQNVSHCKTLTHHERVLRGELTRIKSYLHFLKKDVEAILCRKNELLLQAGLTPDTYKTNDTTDTPDMDDTEMEDDENA